MKTKLIEFLRFLEIETSITFNTDMMLATEKYIDARKMPCAFKGVVAKNGPFLLMISYGKSKKDKKIKGIVLLCFLEDQFCNALAIQSKIKAVVPSIPIIFRNSINDMHLVNLKRIMRDNF